MLLLAVSQPSGGISLDHVRETGEALFRYVHAYGITPVYVVVHGFQESSDVTRVLRTLDPLGIPWRAFAASVDSAIAIRYARNISAWMQSCGSDQIQRRTHADTWEAV